MQFLDNEILHTLPHILLTYNMFVVCSRARRLKFEITFSEGVSDVAKRERCKFIELRQDTYGFEEDDVWHLLKQQSWLVLIGYRYVSALTNRHKPNINS